MILFLTSHIGGSIKVDGKRIPSALRTENHLVENLRSRWPEKAHILFICADPNDRAKSESYQNAYLYAFPFHGMPVASYTVCDGQNENAVEELDRYNVIILSGGHVPTQNAFFHKIGLREKIRNFSGIVIGVSAGTMNCADTVYAHPELEGEAASPTYQRFLTGLGLTKRMVLPHYQAIKEDVIDGLRAFEDIAYPDSRGEEFYCLNDGSYILAENATETLYGEAYLIKDGILKRICSHNQSCTICGDEKYERNGSCRSNR